MKLESIKFLDLSLDEQSDYRLYFMRMINALLEKLFLNNSIESDPISSLKQAIYKLKDPRTNSLHITPLSGTQGKKREATIIQPLSDFDRDAWLLDLLLVDGESYLLELVDASSSVVWSENYPIKKENKL